VTLGRRPGRTLDTALTDEQRHRVAVIRLEVREPPEGGLLIELLEVGRDHDRDRLVGAATSAAELCVLIDAWLSRVPDSGHDP
jgi:hypothetical protein